MSTILFVWLLAITQYAPTVKGSLISEVSETLLPNIPFVSVWNVPSGVCGQKFGVDLNLSSFDIIANNDQTFTGSEVVIFYESRLGLYPRYEPDGTAVNGGLPQLGNLKQHLEKVRRDVESVIPDANFMGVSVIDWESWRPIFDRNGYNKVQKIYVQESEHLVRINHPDWSDEEVKLEARLEFEGAARMYMEQTLELCRTLRPHGHWGFYGFPRCYNYKPGQDFCTNDTLEYNDRLFWMFNNSTVLIPSIYLSNDRPILDRKLRVRGILQETLRMKRLFGSPNVPILAYTRFRYPDSKLYVMHDLKNTIHQSMEAGLAGITFWDSSTTLQSREDCLDLQQYLQTTLGPYVKKVTESARRCSRRHCSSNGRCIKNGWNTTDTSRVRIQKPSLSNNIEFTSYQRFLMSYLKAKRHVTYFKKSRGRKYRNGIKKAYPGRRRNRSRRSIYVSSGYSCYCYRHWRGAHCDK